MAAPARSILILKDRPLPPFIFSSPDVARCTEPIHSTDTKTEFATVNVSVADNATSENCPVSIKVTSGGKLVKACFDDIIVNGAAKKSDRNDLYTEVARIPRIELTLAQ